MGKKCCKEVLQSEHMYRLYSLVQQFVYTFDAVWSQIYFIPHQKCIQIAGPNCRWGVLLHSNSDKSSNILLHNVLSAPSIHAQTLQDVVVSIDGPI